MNRPLRKGELSIHLGALARMGLLDGLYQIAKKHRVLLEDVLDDVRSKTVTKARIACYLHLRALGMSYPEIGKVMLRDHTTVLHAVRRHSHEPREAPEAPAAEGGGEGKAS